MKPPDIPNVNPAALRRAKRMDRIARRIITAGGILIIATVVGMLLLILRVAFPLFTSPSAARITSIDSTTPAILAVGVDDFLHNAYSIDETGTLSIYSLQNTGQRETAPLNEGGSDRKVTSVESWGEGYENLLWDDGALTVLRVTFVSEFDESGNRTTARRVTNLKSFPPPEGPPPLRSWARIADEAATRVDLLESNQLRATRESSKRNLLGEVTTTSNVALIDTPANAAITAVTFDTAGNTLYAGTADGILMRWRLGDAAAELIDNVRATDSGQPITALGLVFGDISIAVGDESGGLATWFPTESSGGGKTLQRIHQMPGHDAPVVRIMPSRRNKSIISIDQAGIVQLGHMTTGRTLITIDPESPVAAAGLASRGDALALAKNNGEIAVWSIDNPHPDVSLQVLAGKVWYENYPKPEFVWQSSAANDDFEPKFSLVPLVFGSFKGTVYAMLFALPLALFGAVYTSQFASNRFRGSVKPVVEVMAAVPSVVIGFLIALWLAPVVEKFLVAFFLSLILIPAFFGLFMLVWRLFTGTGFARRVERGYEFIVIVPVVLASVAAARYAAPPIERIFFDENVQRWLFDSTGERFDQRNALIIAFGLGFAVIPIIFTIAEDSLSNVPNTLKAASLALGASRWQTVWRVVLPSASPGIFAGAIIGFGRAVGETMIVLMATGNTPILDWSPFNGMRTLSANIAVEIPEAPVGGSLYRVLFLSAVLLFVLTSFLNTAAELIRHRLRKRYGQFQ